MGDAHRSLEAQFTHEIALMRRFNHPAIPTLHAEGSQSGVRYLVMDFIDGVDLRTLLGHDGGEPQALGKEIAVYVIAQLADALDHVHTLAEVGDDDEERHLEIVHRDLCPANVLLSRHGDVMLGDFGSASSILLEGEVTSRAAGHAAYKAPERVTGTGAATARSDLFSLAVVLWEMLRGERCFKAQNELETMDAIVRFDISHSSRRVPGLSSKLGEIVRKNLDRDPERRYVDAYAVLQRLAQAPEAASAEAARQELSRLVTQVREARGP